jgi:ribonuclease HII
MDGAGVMQKRKKKPKTASLRHEIERHAEGFRSIVGIDEAGRGAWAGPVVAGAVCLPPPDNTLLETLAGVRDSKEMTPRQRESLTDRIKDTALAYGIGAASHAEIDTLGIVPATKIAMTRAVEMLMDQSDITPDYFFLDSMDWIEAPIDCPHWSVARADKLSLSVAAASVLAKVTRDEMMRGFDMIYPGYAFGRHKGYGTAHHREALKQNGVCKIHRRSFRPIQAQIADDFTGRMV